MNHIIKMNPKVKAMWIEALLSGDYQQGQHYLCQDNNDGSKSWCCLGVLTDLAMKNGVDIDMERSLSESNVYAFDNESETVPATVKSWAGLETASGGYSCPNIDDGDELTCSLAEDNDNGLTFEELVDIIREYF
jgi:hypothetical protein